MIHFWCSLRSLFFIYLPRPLLFAYTHLLAHTYSLPFFLSISFFFCFYLFLLFFPPHCHCRLNRVHTAPNSTLFPPVAPLIIYYIPHPNSYILFYSHSPFLQGCPEYIKQTASIYTRDWTVFQRRYYTTTQVCRGRTGVFFFMKCTTYQNVCFLFSPSPSISSLLAKHPARKPEENAAQLKEQEFNVRALSRGLLFPSLPPFCHLRLTSHVYACTYIYI